MAHNLFSNRFYQNRTVPAWHGLGINSEEPMTAQQAFERLGSYSVGLRPIEITMSDGAVIESPYSHIVRFPTSDDPMYRLFGSPVKAKHYELISPQDACALWDNNVKDAEGKTVPVETFGVLGKGERLFITVKLPTIDVRGDEVNMFMVYDNPMYSGASAGVYTTGVRVVCQNTLTLGISSAALRKTITHLPGTSKEIAKWLGEIYGNALMTAEVAKEAYNILAKKRVKKENVSWIVDSIYKLPGKPDPDRRGDYIHRMEQWEYVADLVQRTRNTVLDLYNGGGTGMDLKACKGTLFGVYNAVAEFETYRRNRGDDYAMDVVNGVRASRIRHAYDLCMELTKEEAQA